MSSTKRGTEREGDDFYPTPAWCTHRLLDRLSLPDGSWLEPCAGDGAIIRVLQERKPAAHITAIEIREECGPQLTALMDPRNVYITNLLDVPIRSTEPIFDVGFSNPPFNQAQEIVTHTRKLCRITVMLLRINFLGSDKRVPFFRDWMPDLYILPNRPSFTGKGTDSIEYAWFVWDRAYAGQERSGRIQVLDPTPVEERSNRKKR